MSIREKLHDRVDAREELDEQARDLVLKIINDHLDEVFEETDKPLDALMALAAIIADKLDPLTTKAVRTGARIGMQRHKAK